MYKWIQTALLFYPSRKKENTQILLRNRIEKDRGLKLKVLQKLTLNVVFILVEYSLPFFSDLPILIWMLLNLTCFKYKKMSEV